VIDRFLVSPVRRPALISGRLVQLGIVSLIQSAIVIVLGLLVGARFPGGLAGLAVLVVCSALLGASLGALSNGMALLARKEETVIAASNFVLLPLTLSCRRRSCSATSCPAGSRRWPGTTRSSGPSRRAARP
jgi:ABC-2 type transport system permease protein